MSTIDRYVSTNADIKISRSRFPLNRRSKFSYFHGYLHPVGSPLEVLPSDTWKINCSAFTRMSTPIVPFMDDVRQEVDFWFVPKRILNNNVKQFYGEAKDFGIAEKVIEPSFSTLSVDLGDFTPGDATKLNLRKSETLAAAFGMIYQYHLNDDFIYLNGLPIQAYFSVYNEYYRDENYQNPYVWDKDLSGYSDDEVAYLDDVGITGLSLLPKVNKDRDVLTSVLPWVVKGDPVGVAVDGLAPVVVGAMHGMDADDTFEGIRFGFEAGATNYDSYSGMLNLNQGYVAPSDDAPGGDLENNITRSNLYAKLDKAAKISITDLLYSLAYNNFLSRCARFGTRFKEYIYAMFGCKIPDLTADVPEYLGRLRFNINVQQVVQTTGFTASSSTSLGALGAYSNSGKYDKIFTKSFTEPGYIVVVTYTKHQRTISTGIDRVFIKNELLDYYQTPFANIPDVPYSTQNYWLTGPASERAGGFQEPWYDYRSAQDRVYGLMNPMVDSLGEIWTLAEKWSTRPTINGKFMEEDRDAIARALATGVAGPDYLCDILLECEVTRAMPLYSSGTLGTF